MTKDDIRTHIPVLALGALRFVRGTASFRLLEPVGEENFAEERTQRLPSYMEYARPLHRHYVLALADGRVVWLSLGRLVYEQVAEDVMQHDRRRLPPWDLRRGTTYVVRRTRDPKHAWFTYAVDRRVRERVEPDLASLALQLRAYARPQRDLPVDGSVVKAKRLASV